VYRINSATPFPVLIGIYLLCFAFIFIWLIFSVDRALVLEAGYWNYIWADSLRQFIIYFLAIHCSGMLIAFSLFARKAMGFQRKALLKFMSTLVLTLIIITGLYIFIYETVFPLLNAYVKDLRTQSSWSAELYKGAEQKEGAGDYKTALTYIDLSLSLDSNNAAKINRRSQIMKNLSSEELQAYEQRRTGGLQSGLYSGENVQSLLQKAENALAAKDYTGAYNYAGGVLTLDSRNSRAMWISDIAWEEISEKKLNPEIEKTRYLISEKRRGFNAFLRGDYPAAYYIFKTLEKQYPHDSYIQYYLGEITQKLPAISFFTDEAELVVSLPIPALDYLVFFNLNDESTREIISIDRIVSAANGTFFRNVEVLGFLSSGGILYHYVAPYGKLIDGYININGMDRDTASQAAGPRFLSGVPPVDRQKGIKLNINPLDFPYYRLSPGDLHTMSIWQLLKSMEITKDYMNNQRVLILEIILKLSAPLLLLIFSLVCARIALGQGVDYITGPPGVLYLFLPIIPFIVLFAVNLVMYLYNICIGFVYFSLGGVFTVLVLLAGALAVTALLFINITRRLYKARSA
jgi:hypothetical protein